MGYSYLQKPHSERGREFKVSSICLRTAVYLHYAIETDLLTAEGMSKIQQQKIKKASKTIKK